MQELRLAYVNVFVSDFENSITFYQDKLNLPVKMQDAEFGYASFENQGASFAIARVDPQSPQADLVGRHTGIGWVVESVDRAFAELEQRGVEFEQPPQQQPWGGYMAIFKDPDGNLFYLDQPHES